MSQKHFTGVEPHLAGNHSSGTPSQMAAVELPLIDRICIFGLNHNTAPIGIRELFAVPPETRGLLISRLLSCAVIEEAAVVSTCNRVEFVITLSPVVFAGMSKTPDSAVRSMPLGRKVGVPHHLLGVERSIAMFMQEVSGLASESFRQFLYIYSGEEAIDHLLSVASGLDSMVPGESEILGQLKSAYSEAHSAGGTGRLLNPLFQSVFRSAKHVRTNAAIGRQVSSIVSLTRRIARKTFSDLSTKRLLVIGAGDTAELAVKQFHAAGIGSIVVLNRTVEKADALAQTCSGICGSLDDLERTINDSDIVVAAALLSAHAEPLINSEMIAGRSEPLLLLDLGVPRNAGDCVRNNSSVMLYNIDDLENEVKEASGLGALEIKRAEGMIHKEAADIVGRLNRISFGETIEEVKARATCGREKQVERAVAELRRRGLSEQDCVSVRQVLVDFYDRAVAEILHAPLSTLSQTDDKHLLEAFRQLFLK